MRLILKKMLQKYSVRRGVPLTEYRDYRKALMNTVMDIWEISEKFPDCSQGLACVILSET